MQSFSTPSPAGRPRLLVVEFWGLGDVALAIPFLRAAARHVDVTLVAQPHAQPLLQRFCPEVKLIPFFAPWVPLRGKYRLHRWPWGALRQLIARLRAERFDTAVSVRPDPRDHLLLALAGASCRGGFPRAGSSLLLTERLARPRNPHRAAAWAALASHFGWSPDPVPGGRPRAAHIVIHTSAAQPTREWPRERFETVADRLRREGHSVTLLDSRSGNLDDLLATLAGADRFVGNDSGPGHVAALLGVPTFTIFGAQKSENFHPVHPRAAWIEGTPCPFKPCHDSCRFPEPYCIRRLSVDDVWAGITRWLAT